MRTAHLSAGRGARHAYSTQQGSELVAVNLDRCLVTALTGVDELENLTLTKAPWGLSRRTVYVAFILLAVVGDRHAVAITFSDRWPGAETC